MERINTVQIRAEKPEDIAGIRQVNLAAFGRSSEADLVDRLRGLDETFSFVAILDEQIVGHIFFSPVTIEQSDQRLLGLAPVAILPKYQRQGIGSQLIRYSLERCGEAGFSAIVVLGHQQYYPRFGFVPAKQKGLWCEFGLSEESFMVLELAGALEDCAGMVKYRSEFNEFE